jgi:hypothetical protein
MAFLATFRRLAEFFGDPYGFSRIDKVAFLGSIRRRKDRRRREEKRHLAIPIFDFYVNNGDKERHEAMSKRRVKGWTFCRS